MLAVLDIGNTSVTYGIYKGERLISFRSEIHINIPKIVKKIRKSGGNSNITVLISSVVPKITHQLKRTFIQAPRIKLLVLGENIEVPVKHNYGQPKRLGQDRLVNVYGAIQMYKPPLLVIDYGTAVTMDYVSRRGVFEGGLIIPGPEISFQALIEKAALLPKKLRLPERSTSFIGKTTYDCMSSGILQAYGAMTDGLIERFRKQYGPKLFVIATGGFAKHLKIYSKNVDRVDPGHSIKSLYLLFQAIQKL